MTKMPALHVRSMKINRNSLVVILISVVITLMLYIFFFNVVSSDKEKAWEDNNITSIVNKIPKLTSELQVGDLYQIGTREKVDASGFMKEIINYNLTTSDGLRGFGQSKLLKEYEITDKYNNSWITVFETTESQKYSVMFYPTVINASSYVPSNINVPSVGYKLLSFNFPSKDSQITFDYQDELLGSFVVTDVGLSAEFQRSLELNSEVLEYEGFDKRKLKQVKTLDSSFDLYRYEIKSKDGNNTYRYGDGKYISFQNSCGDKSAPCGFLIRTIFNITCVVDNVSKVELCDNLVGSLKVDPRNWAEFNL